MSLRGRHVIDRIKRVVSPYLLLPVPPYESTNYWEHVYQSFGPSDVFEWGDLTLAHHLYEYQYRPLPLPLSLPAVPSSSRMTKFATTAVQQQVQTAAAAAAAAAEPSSLGNTRIPTSWGETLNTFPVPEEERNKESKDNNIDDEPILILGCGNSKLGEDMLEPRRRPHSNSNNMNDDDNDNDSHSHDHNLVRWRGPIMQVDIASRVVDAMGQRCHEHIACGDMMVLQDDATELSAIPGGTSGNGNATTTIHAAIDKGLVDALFCANQAQSCYNVMQAVHRVLIPGGVLAIFSYSRPEFLLETLLVPPHLHTNKSTRTAQTREIGSNNNKRAPLQWGNVQVRQLDSILLYRFQKATPPVMTSVNLSNSTRPRQQSRQRRR
jgi:hypothetical protein